MAVVSSIWAGLLLATVAYAQGSYYDDLYMQDLYKRLSELDAYLPEDEGPYWLDEGPMDDQALDDIALASRDPGQANIRDQEYTIHGPMKGGFQYISGGAGEGAQHLTPEGTQNNTQEVKSDETLPFYCHPPNPCPKGFTAADGCQDDVDDSAETQKQWIEGLMKTGKCTCDEEHMFECPKNLDTMNTEKGHRSRDNLDRVLDNLLNKNEGGNPYAGGDKRQYIVAKKAPGMVKRSSEHPHPYKKSSHQLGPNPFLEGDRLPTVAKKGFPSRVIM